MTEKDPLEINMHENNSETKQYATCSCCCEEEKKIDESDELKKVVEERNEYLLLAQRVQADFENYKKRNRSAVLDACQSTTAETIGQFIPVLDNIERALESVSADSAADVLFKGVAMIAKQFKDLLRQMDVYEIEALNKPFDPHLHEAVLMVDTQLSEQKNIVIEVLQKGYICKEKVIRHSMVKVSC